MTLKAKTAGEADLPGSPDENARFRLDMHLCLDAIASERTVLSERIDTKTLAVIGSHTPAI